MKYVIQIHLIGGLFLFLFLFPQRIKAQTLVTLDMMTQDDKPLVNVRINGQNAYFLVDTGSDVSLLFSEYKVAFDFQTKEGIPSGLKSITGVQGRSVALQRTYHARVEAEGCYFPVRFPALQGGRYLEVVAKNSELQIVGIIGVDLMRQLKMQIDYGANEVTMAFPDRVCDRYRSDVVKSDR